MIRLRQTINKVISSFNNEIDLAVGEGKGKDFVRKMVRKRNRWQCRNDLFFLCGVVGQDKVTSIPREYEPFCDEVSLQTWQVPRLKIHEPTKDLLPLSAVCDEEDLSLQRLYLCFRAYYKTTVISKVHSLQLLLNFPNIHIVLCHNKQENASKLLVAVKNMFLSTEIKDWFPECIPDTKEWGSMSRFSIANRTDMGREEDNIMAVGVDTEITGGHWQIAKKNDLVTEKSVKTKEQIEKTLDWDSRFNIGHFDTATVRLQDYEGTRYHFADMYSTKINDKNIKLKKIPLLNNFKDNESCPIPERFSADDIQKLKEDDPWTFWCQMMLEPKDPAKMRFSPEMIHYYTSLPKGMNFYLLIDPASARKKKSDYTVMKVVGIDSKGKRYIADVIRDKLDPKQRVDEAIRLSLRWEVKGIGWEAIGFQSTDCFYFEEARRKTKLRVTPQEIKSHSASKEDRIRGLMPEYASSKWLWPPKGAIVQNSKFTGKSYDISEDMEYEFLHFPLAEHDDLLDVQTFLNLMDTNTPQPVENLDKPKGLTYGEYAGIKDRRLEYARNNPWGVFARQGY